MTATGLLSPPPSEQLYNLAEPPLSTKRQLQAVRFIVSTIFLETSKDKVTNRGLPHSLFPCKSRASVLILGRPQDPKASLPARSKSNQNGTDRLALRSG